MAKRFKKHLTPGLVLGLIALIVAVGGSSFAIAQSGKKQTLRTRLGGATQHVVQTVTLRPQTDNAGVSDHTVTCPSNPKLGPGVAVGGGVIDPRPPDNTRAGEPYSESTNGPSPTGTGAWLFEFDNDTAEALPVQLRVVCTFSKLNTKRG
jgi:hypothetical protein